MYGPWYMRFGLGIACVALGAISLLAAFWMQFGGHREITTPPDPLVTVPLLVLAIAAGVWSFLRREKMRALPIAGVSMAAAAAVLGWIVVVACVGVVALVALLVIAKFH
jgi:hypothetical protein